MKSKFKVLDWLRGVRDRSAAEEREMSDAERLERLKRKAAPLVTAFLKSCPRVRRRSAVAANVVKEGPAEYRARKRR